MTCSRLVEEDEIHSVQIVVDKKLSDGRSEVRFEGDLYLKVEWDVSFVRLKFFIHHCAGEQKIGCSGRTAARLDF